MRVDFHHVTFGMEEVKAVVDALHDNWFSPRGPKLAEFGQKMADLVGKKFGWPVSSGTAAIHTALFGLGVGPGDRVAVPSYTCSPTVFPVSYVGAEPLFVDCEKATYGTDPFDLDAKLKQAEHEGRPCKAVILVHLYGAGCDDRVFDVCAKYGLKVIEDTCESDGASYRDGSGLLGQKGDVACFSFRGDKVLTALGTGGIFVTDDEESFERMKLFSDLALKVQSTAGRYRDLEFVAPNYEISNPAAAFGIAQIDRLPEIKAGRQRSARMWYEALAKISSPKMQPMDWYDGHVFYQMPLMFTELTDYTELDQLCNRLVARKTPLIPPFWPMEAQKMYLHLKQYCPVSHYCAGHVLLFPCYPELTQEQIEYMVEVITEEYAAVLSSRQAVGVTQ